MFLLESATSDGEMEMEAADLPQVAGEVWKALGGVAPSFRGGSFCALLLLAVCGVRESDDRARACLCMCGGRWVSREVTTRVQIAEGMFASGGPSFGRSRGVPGLTLPLLLLALITRPDVVASVRTCAAAVDDGCARNGVVAVHLVPQDTDPAVNPDEEVAVRPFDAYMDTADFCLGQNEVFLGAWCMEPLSRRASP
ncbi:unnamed protein product [Lampetra fluviatilis]